MPLDDLDIADIRQWITQQNVKVARHASYSDDEVAIKVLEVVTHIYEKLLEEGLIKSREPTVIYCPPELRRTYVEPESLIIHIPKESQRGRHED